MKERCFDYEYEKDTGGNPVMRRKCFCGTTICMQWAEIKERKLNEDGIDEEAFYKKALATKLI